ncbi:hypothetical protein SAMN02745146_2906 [Hymenobacter daecheongensis DSM 21074]|uniref:Uncharacterized protein n=1 Tax=Hymenobacter daecheongensis DSM 21074 TaxID=1121955 RepID=A0A1M6IMV1_9BACT|nr:hypothetical protein [Hymenobacter daecheongensis]SHJ35826.1 hypothetical protein SAMN02745146_2906 [Hymenobacter daecheongensis DSM 21074]
MAEEYADKMARKTDAELHHYVTGRAQYRDDAVLAALDELARRGQPHPEDYQVRPELEAVVQAQVAQAAEVRQLAERQTEVAAAPDSPVLYSPVTIAMFSMFFSFLAGGILLAINMFRLKEGRKGLAVVMFMLGLMLASSYALQWLMQTYALGLRTQLVSVAINLVAVLAYLLFFWPRYVGARPYVSRPWLSALLVCMALIGLYMWALPHLLPLAK